MKEIYVVGTALGVFIGKYIDGDNGVIILEEPMMLKSAMTPQGLAMELLPVIPMPKDNRIIINVEQLLYEIDVQKNKSLIDEYEKAVAKHYKGIELGTAKDIPSNIKKFPKLN